MRARTHTHTHAHAHTLPPLNLRVRERVQLEIIKELHARARTHTRIHAHTHTRTHTHTHTHTPPSHTLTLRVRERVQRELTAKDAEIQSLTEQIQDSSREKRAEINNAAALRAQICRYRNVRDILQQLQQIYQQHTTTRMSKSLENQ